MNKLIYSVNKSNVKDYYNVKISIDEENALNVFDVGETEIICINKERVEYELSSYVSLGYTLESIVENEFKILGWL